MGILQGKIGMATLDNAEIGYFSLDPHREELLLKERLEISGELSHRKNLGRAFLKSR